MPDARRRPQFHPIRQPRRHLRHAPDIRPRPAPARRRPPILPARIQIGVHPHHAGFYMKTFGFDVIELHGGRDERVRMLSRAMGR